MVRAVNSHVPLRLICTVFSFSKRFSEIYGTLLEIRRPKRHRHTSKMPPDSPRDFRPFWVSVAGYIFSDLIRYFKLKYSAFWRNFCWATQRKRRVFEFTPRFSGGGWFPTGIAHWFLRLFLHTISETH